ncbi:hypothetical protein [Ferrimicrobium acidiphilum]|uniref:hypothetical protein n=1 Tax=Ferrimicrobium acidiphilum TaxID=121039 RepID=UPI0023F1D11F|nr:hypothetical protein [Ferrimicrobium acidiphilum]
MIVALFTRNKKTKEEPNPFLPGDGAIPPPQTSVRRGKPKKRVTTRKLQTPTQTEARKASRLRGIVFAVALVVIGLLGLIITSSPTKAPTYTVYEVRTYVAPGVHITASELQPVTVHAPVPGAATRAEILRSVPTTAIYSGEVIESPTLASAKTVPVGYVLEGASLAPNHAPNSPLFVGEKVAVYYSASSSSNQNATTGIINLLPGQVITQAVVVSTAPATSSNTNVAVDMAVPARSAGDVAMAIANNDVTIGVL